jgi:translation initiation factor 2B subunit (eIF-2B alpha/beta/delta family)
VLITPILSSIATLVRTPPPAASSSSFSSPIPSGTAGTPDILPPSTPSQDADTKGPIGGEGEIAEELQQVYNPSFDVTPADLIGAIVTEKGVAVKEDGKMEYELAESRVVQ